MKKPKPAPIDLKQDQAISQLQDIDRKHDGQFAFMFFFTGLIALWCFALSLIVISK